MSDELTKEELLEIVRSMGEMVTGLDNTLNLLTAAIKENREETEKIGDICKLLANRITTLEVTSRENPLRPTVSTEIEPFRVDSSLL